MPDPKVPSPLLDAIRDLLAWLGDEQVPGVVVGGVAASILGRPRLTRDVDTLVLLEEERWPSFLEAGKRHRIEPRKGDAVEFARQSRVLLVRHRESGIDIDVALGILPFEEETVRRARTRQMGGLDIPLPTPEDLIIMKAVAHRPRDMSDIESVLDVSEGLDGQRIREWVRAFSEGLEMPHLQEDVDRILTRYQL